MFKIKETGISSNNDDDEKHLLRESFIVSLILKTI